VTEVCSSRYMEAANHVGMRRFLTPDELAFVGRRREMRIFESAIQGVQVKPLWVWGPRRMGKTSLSHALYCSQAAKIVRISCDEYDWQGIDDFGELIGKEVHSQLGMQLNGSGKSCIKEIGKQSANNNRILLVLDEFDRFAVNLEMDEQAFLRATLQKYPYLGILFISRQRPEQLLQDYSEDNSRLLGVCGIIRMPMLEIIDILTLAKRLGTICEEDLPAWLSTWVYESVGGYPVCVQALIHEFLIMASHLGRFPSEEEFDEGSYAVRDSVNSDLTGLWSDLPRAVRTLLLTPSEEVPDKIIREFKAMGLWVASRPVRPAWLLEFGTELNRTEEGHSVELIGLAEALNNGIQDCNYLALRKCKTQAFQVTQEVFKIFEIARPIKNTVHLNDRINTLYKLCVESVSFNLIKNDEDRCLIPQAAVSAYTKSDGFQILLEWTNFTSYDLSHASESEESSKRYKDIGQIFSRYLGPGHCKPTGKDECNIIYRGILVDIVQSVKMLQEDLQQLVQLNEEDYRGPGTGQMKDLDMSVSLRKIIEGGESDKVEFKSTLRINLHTGSKDSKIELAVIRTIAAFLNSNGGILAIGFADDRTPLGIAADRFENEDKMNLHLVKLIKDCIGPPMMRFIHASFEDFDSHRVMVIKCSRTKTPAFVKDGNIEHFYIRTGPSTTELTTSQTHEYIKQREVDR
jgi:hypothetical protein